MRQRVIPAVAAAFVVSALLVPAAQAGAAPREPKAAPAVPPHRQTGRLQVKFKSGTSRTARDNALAKVRARGLALHVDRSIGALNAVVVRASNPRAAHALLRNDPTVEYVEPESTYVAAVDEEPSAEMVEVGAAAVRANVDTPYRGAGQTIAVLDMPVNATVDDLNGPGKVVSAGDFTTDYVEQSGDPYHDYPCDPAACPHGTAVAAAAAGEAGDGGMVGVAPEATVRSYGIFRRWTYTDANGTTEFASAATGDTAAALTQLATDAAADPSIVAANMSIEGDFDSKLFRDAIALVHANAPRVTITVAAGNDGTERANFPAADPYVLSVGATGQHPDNGDCADAVAPSTPWTVTGFSNKGKVDVVAPGRCITLPYPTYNTTTGAVNPGTLALRPIDGTSFAAPMVAGIAALLANASPTAVGDAARAAIIASAQGTASTPTGAGKANAAAAVALVKGTAPYTAVTTDRGGQVASTVGHRQVEVLRVDPTAATTPAAPTPTVSATYGSVAALTTPTPAPAATAGTARKYFTFTAKETTAGATFSLTAAGGNGGDDTTAIPMTVLPAYDSFEGQPAGTGETGTLPLTFGSRTAYVRSATVRSGGEIDFAFTLGYKTPDPSFPPGAALFLWEPTSSGGTADAAGEPFWQVQTDTPTARTGSDYLLAGSDFCEYLGGDPELESSYRTCRAGRYLIGFMTFGSRDSSDSTHKYSLSLTYPGPTVTATAPTIASTTSATGPFTVSWGGNTRAVAWDVQYAVKSKVGSSYVLGAWKPWKTKTAGKSATFGSGNLPEKVSPGRTYHFRVVAYDSLGNPSVASTSKYTNAPYDDRSSLVTYSTGSTAWTRVVVGDRWLSTATKSSAAGARASMTTDTSAFSLVGDKCAACGKFAVYVDGKLKATVDTYASSTLTRRVLWTSGSLGSVASHRITVIVSGTAGRPKVVLDGISILR